MVEFPVPLVLLGVNHVWLLATVQLLPVVISNVFVLFAGWLTVNVFDDTVSVGATSVQK